MIDIRDHTHLDAWASEVEAFKKAVKSANSMKLQILEELETAGHLAGLTPDEFAEMHGKLINTVRRRFTDLWKEGKIRHHPKELTRKNKAGNSCVTWVLGYDPASFQKHAKRQWVGLTNEDKEELYKENGLDSFSILVKVVEAKLKEKNT